MPVRAGCDLLGESVVMRTTSFRTKIAAAAAALALLGGAAGVSAAIGVVPDESAGIGRMGSPKDDAGVSNDYEDPDVNCNPNGNLGDDDADYHC